MISWIFIGNFMLLNLFLAILLDSFAEEEEDDMSFEEKKMMKQQSKEEDATLEGYTLIKKINDYTIMTGKESKKRKGAFIKKKKKKDGKKEDKVLDQSYEFDPMEIRGLKKKKKKKVMYDGVECEVSFFIFKKKNFFRKICYHIAHSNHFENLILVLIVFSSLKLVVDTYLTNYPADSLLK